MVNRLDRVNGQIQKAISESIIYNLQNPKIKNALITISKVDISADFSHAKVFVSIFPDNGREEVFNALKTCVPFLRKEVARKVKLRITPELHLFMDTSEEYASRIDSLLNKISEGNKND